MKYFYVCLVGMVFAINSFANDIAATTTNPLCDNATLAQYNGTVDVEVNWAPNVISLNWYDGNTQLNVPVESQSCTYDGAMYIPPQPTKTGYTFKGWKVIPQYDFSTLPADLKANNRYGNKYNDGGKCWKEWEHIDCDNSYYDDLNNREWKAEYNFGTIYGESLCSVTSGEQFDSGTPDNTTNSGARYCWCKVTGYLPNGQTTKYVPSNGSSWIFYYDADDQTNCKYGCSINCAHWLAFTRNIHRVFDN